MRQGPTKELGSLDSGATKLTGVRLAGLPVTKPTAQSLIQPPWIQDLLPGMVFQQVPETHPPMPPSCRPKNRLEKPVGVPFRSIVIHDTLPASVRDPSAIVTGMEQPSLDGLTQ